MSLKMITLATLQPNPHNPRKDFDPTALEELAASIKELGLLQPLVVYVSLSNDKGSGPENEHYTVLCGDRRRQACKLAGMKEIPCRVIDPPADKAAAVQLALVENLQRADLSIAEEAPAIVELIENGMKRSEVAKALGKSIKYVGTRYSLGKYSEVLEAFVKAGGRDMETWSLLGGIETPEIRKRIIKDFSRGYGYANSKWRGDVNNVRKLEKRVSEFGVGLEERALSSFCKTYKNPKQKIPPCCEGWNDDKNICQFMLDLDYQVAAWLGTDHRGVFCNSESQTCLEYKRERESAELAKVKRCKKKRIMRRRYVNGDWKTMKSGRFGKVCEKCKERYKVPYEFHYERGIEDPYEYCLAEDDACYKKKLAKFLAAVPVNTTAELREATDERVQEAFRETLEGCEGCWRIRDCRKELDKRGYVPKLAVEFEKVITEGKTT